MWVSVTFHGRKMDAYLQFLGLCGPPPLQQTAEYACACVKRVLQAKSSISTELTCIHGVGGCQPI